ncbi:MAG: Mov34/MPN/PAD-1 family protein [candidate division WOR-3 bacterium]|nr:Mov34/MPN/PAD-1 family protein [candidate division WOR-3 bacterium]
MERAKTEVKNKKVEAYLSLPAFLSIVSSSIETFKKETIGYLIGVKGENKYMVEYAIPYQTAESSFAHVTIDLKRVERVNSILRLLSEGLEYIGEFHSHTAFGESRAYIIPSSEDLLTTVPGELNIICAVNPKKRSVKWYENKNGALIGTVDEYRIEIGGYFVKKPAIGKKYQRVRIKCPSVTGIGVKR